MRIGADRRALIAGALAAFASGCAPTTGTSASPSTAGAPARVALVIGNGGYAGGVPPLPNPPRDAAAMAASLRRLGFLVDLLTNGDREAMEAAVQRLADASADADAAVVFYAGHAAEVGGTNLLFPTSIRLDTADLQREALPLDTVLRAVAGRARSTMIFLDACRDNPFAGMPIAAPAELGRQVGGTTRSVGSGLGPVSSTVRTLIAFSTAPGHVAMDGGGRNSPFTAALLRYIETPDVDVREMLGRVRRTVREETNGQQIPWDNSSLEGSFYFSNQVAEPLLRQAIAFAAKRGIPLPDLKVESIQDSRSASTRLTTGVWGGTYASGRQVLVIVFLVEESRQRADVLYAEGPATPASRVQSPGNYLRRLIGIGDRGLLLRRENGWSYRLDRLDDDELALTSIRLSGEVDAATRLRRMEQASE